VTNGWNFHLQLTEHFCLDEFQKDGLMPAECVYPYTKLCEMLLEPLRIHYGEPIVITSGYRPPEANTAAHGVAHSQHMANGNYCAADWYIPSMRSDMRQPFDLIRSSSALQFDQLILEHGVEGDIIHASWNRVFNRRDALEGETANASEYKPWPSVEEHNV
jgi:hypothetical protein